MSGMTVAARLARREVVRRPWRSVVVLLIIVAPVMVLTAIAVITRTTDRSWEEQFAREAGTEDLRIFYRAIADENGQPIDVDIDGFGLPADSRVVEATTTGARLRTVDGERMWATVTDQPLGDPISEGLIHRLEGRTPRTSDEVLLSPRVSRALEVDVGDTLHLDRPADFEATVVGIAEWGRQLNTTTMAVGPDGGAATVEMLAGGEAYPTWLVDLPASHERDEALIQPILDRGGEARFVPPARVGGASAQVTIVWTWVGGAVAFTILGVVIAAAFAVTARRQLRLIGQLMGNGSDERTLRATLFLQGTVLGAAGAIVGIALTVVGLNVFQPTVETILGQRIDAWEVRPADIIPILVISTVAATAAAVIPARSAVATTVLQALAGRRPVGPYPRRLVVRGAVAAAAGLGLLAVATAGASSSRNNGGSSSSTTLFALTGIAGAIGVLLGTCAMTPAIISRLEPLAGMLRGTARLAARSVARQRTRTGAVVAAIAVVAAGGVAGSTAWMTTEARDEAHGGNVPDDLVMINYSQYRIPEDMDAAWELVEATPPTEVVEQVLAVAPNAKVVPNRRAVVPSATGADSSGPWFQVVDEAYADAFDVHPDVVDALASGAAVEAWWGDPSDAPPEIPIIDETGVEIGTVPRATFPPSMVSDWSHGPMITEETARSLGLDLVDGPLTLQTPEPMTGDQRDRLTDLSDDLAYDYMSARPQPGDLQTNVHLTHPYETFEPSDALITAGIVGVATVLVLAVVALGLSLSAAETKDERDVLAAMGARPRTLRRLAAAKAAVLSTTGMVVGIPLGFIPVVVVMRAASMDNFTPYSPVFPWVQVGLLLVVVPLIATVATIAASGIALRMRPVTASSMAFD